MSHHEKQRAEKRLADDARAADEAAKKAATSILSVLGRTEFLQVPTWPCPGVLFKFCSQQKTFGLYMYSMHKYGACTSEGMIGPHGHDLLIDTVRQVGLNFYKS